MDWLPGSSSPSSSFSPSEAYNREGQLCKSWNLCGGPSSASAAPSPPSHCPPSSSSTTSPAPLGWLPDAVAYDNILSLLGNPVSKLLLIVLLSTTLFHAAHRIATLPADFKLPVPKTLASAVSHLSALALSVVTVLLVLAL